MSVKYSEDHEWVRLEGDNIVTIGITDYAQEQLGDIVFVDLPDVGKSLKKGDEAAVVESVKAASEVYAAVSGEIVEVNASLSEAPQTVNEAAEDAGWFLKIKLSDSSEFNNLMDADDYQRFLDNQ